MMPPKNNRKTMSNKTKSLISRYITAFGGSMIGCALTEARVSKSVCDATFISLAIAVAAFLAAGIIARDLD